MEYRDNRPIRYFGTLALGIALYLFFTLPFWEIFAPINKLEGAIGIILALAGVFLTIVGFIFVMELLIESRFKKKDKQKYPYTPTESYFSDE